MFDLQLSGFYRLIITVILNIVFFISANISLFS